MTLSRRLVAEALGTALLLATIVGSGIMGDRLSNGNVAIALLANSIATGAVLTALIFMLEPVSGAHFNPVVTLAVDWKAAPAYIPAQLAGAFAGVAAAHFMFGEPVLQLSRHARSGQMFSEFIATFGLLSVVWGAASNARFAVGLYIMGAYWFTSSTSFANPAVTLARVLTDTFAGIRPQDAPGFIAAQCAGALAATLLWRWLRPKEVHP